MLEEVEVPAFVLRINRQRIEPAPHGLHVVPVLDLFLGEQRLHIGRARVGQQLAPCPGQLTSHFVRAAVAHAMVPAVGEAAHVEHYRLERRRVVLRGASGRVRREGRAPHTDGTVGVRLLREPLDDVVAVGRVGGLHLGKRAFRLVATARVLQRHHVAAFGVPHGQFGERRLVVRRAIQQNG